MVSPFFTAVNIDGKNVAHVKRAVDEWFLDGRIALANVSGESVSRVLPLRLQLRQFRTGLVEFLGFNFRDGRPTRNLALRRALQAAIDTDVLLNRVVRLPAARLTD